MKIGVVEALAAGLCCIKQAISFGCEEITLAKSYKIRETWMYVNDIRKINMEIGFIPACRESFIHSLQSC